MAQQTSLASNSPPTDNPPDIVVETISSPSLGNSSNVAAGKSADKLTDTVMSCPSTNDSSKAVAADKPTDTVMETASSPEAGTLSNNVTVDNHSDIAIDTTSSPMVGNSSNAVATNEQFDAVMETTSSSAIEISSNIATLDSLEDTVVSNTSSHSVGNSSDMAITDNLSDVIIEIASSPSTDNSPNLATANNLADVVVSVMSSPSVGNSSDIAVAGDSPDAVIEIMSCPSVGKSSNVAIASNASGAVIEITSSPLDAGTSSDTTPIATSLHRLPLAVHANARRPGYPAFAFVNKEAFHAFLKAYICIDKNPNDPIVYHPDLIDPVDMQDYEFAEAAFLAPGVDCIYLNPRTDEISLGYKTDIPGSAFYPGFINPNLGDEINCQLKMVRIVMEDFSAWTDGHDYPLLYHNFLNKKPVANIDVSQLKYPNINQITVLFRGLENEWKGDSNHYVVNYNVATNMVFVDYDRENAEDMVEDTFRLEAHKVYATQSDEMTLEPDGNNDENDKAILSVRIIFHRDSDKDYGPHLLEPFDLEEVLDPEDLTEDGRMERIFWEIAATAVKERLCA
ncbi:uncharacterized protein BDZ83DRAFT_791501 [Colletotrichum acutatum]|uniref:Uncharacterized protein n=1 Tax=Glomerella acutata TaxID=27357 RepID=A0AAD8XH47_GLOAC|nr:uncharacterized protein BDZ83DRAFT_791501 [Colletotrichum acutatum]KAK1726091.1 hypothetical protein BDZ83DRAFT_791501 [Colletotrichum acutatum]